MEVSRKDTIQRSIDLQKQTSLKSIAMLEAVEQNEQELKDKIKRSIEQNSKLEIAIKTQVYMLRNMADSYEKFVESTMKRESGIADDGMTVNSRRSGKTIKMLFNDSPMSEASP